MLVGDHSERENRRRLHMVYPRGDHSGMFGPIHESVCPDLHGLIVATMTREETYLAFLRFAYPDWEFAFVESEDVEQRKFDGWSLLD